MRVVVAAVVAALLAAPAVAGIAFATRNGRLIRITTPDPQTVTVERQSDEADEYSSVPTVSDERGELVITGDFYCGALTLTFRLLQEPCGQIEIETSLIVSGWESTIASRHYSAERYTDLADQRLLSGDRLSEILAYVGDGCPPVDIDALAARLSVDTAEVTPDTRALIDDLGSAYWYDRENAAKLLSKDYRLPQLRQALATIELSAEQRKQIECILNPQRAGAAVQAAAGANKP